MVYVVGVTLVIVGILMFLRLAKISRRPKVYDARITKVFKDFREHPKYPGQPSPRKLRQASVEYFYRSMKYENDVLLKSRRKQPVTV